MFHGERNWLMFADSLETSVNVLTNQNINSDAEITLVLQNKQKYICNSNIKKLEIHTPLRTT